MKKENTKKNKLWLWIVIAVAVLAILGAVAAFVLPGLFRDNGPAGPAAEAKLYWNLDRMLWLEAETNFSLRPKGEDGYYHISYLVDGKVEDVKVSDKRLLNYLDGQDLLCLAFDEAGICVDAVPIETYFTETAKDMFVKRYQNNTVELNSSISMDGMNMQLPIPEGIQIYDVSVGAEQPGAVITPDWLDACSAYSDLEGNLTNVYITGHNAVDAEIAWKVNIPSSSGIQDEPDENGVYNLEFVVDGEIVVRKCRDEKIIAQMNSVGTWNRSMGLLFDEEGYIINTVSIQVPLRGIQIYSDAIVESINGNVVTGTTMTGVPVEFAMGDNCVIYNTCGGGCQDDHYGEKVEQLFIGDRIQVYADLDGKAILIYKSISRVDVPVYYKLNKTTDAEGYTVYTMAVDGKVKDFRTKDAEVVKSVDKHFDNTMGLIVSGSTIKKAVASNCVVGFTRGANGSWVTAAQFPVLTHISYTDPTSVNALLMNADCKVYLVDDYYKTKQGSVTEVQEYDRIVALRNPNSEVVYVFVIQRYRPGHKLAVNLDRQYVGNETTRVPDADGYYVFDIASEGKQMQVKTKDKKIANYIDKQNYPIFGIKSNNGIITSVCNAEAVFPFAMKSSNNHRVESLENNILQTAYTNNGINKVVYGNLFTLTSKTKVYNLTTDNYSEYRGEKTKLKIYDKVQALTKADTGEIEYVFVSERPQAQTKLYANVESMPPMGTIPVRTPDADGYYNIKVYSDGKTITVRTKDAAICALIDGNGLSIPYGLTFQKGTNIIEAYYPTTQTQHYYSLGPVEVIAIDEESFTVKYAGQTTEYVLTLGEDTKVIDIDPNSKTVGKRSPFKQGDRIRVYSDGEITYIFITKRAGKAKDVLVLDKKGYGECPTCGKVKWEEYTGAKRYGTTDDGPLTEHVHLYLADDASYTGSMSINAAILGTNGKICLHLNGHTLNITNSRFWMGYESTNNELYIYGTDGGAIEYTQRTPVQSNSGPVHVIGGTYTPVGDYMPFASVASEATFEDATVYADIVTNAKDAHIVLKGSTKTYMINLDAGGALELDSSWSGTAILDMEAAELTDGKVPADKVYYTGKAPTGAMKLATGEPLVYNNGALEIGYPDELELDSKGYDECEICGEKVKWEKFDGKKQYLNITTHRHFYLAENTNYTNANIEMMTIGAGGKVCFNLNGKSLTVANGRILFTEAATEASALNILTTNGKILYSNPTDSFIQQNKGKITINGGTYSAVDTAADFVSVTGSLIVKDATVKAKIASQSTSALIELQGFTKVNKVNLDNGGKMKLNSNWSGVAVLDMQSSDLVKGKVPADKVFYTGDAPTGIVMLASCETLMYKGGALQIDSKPSGELVLDEMGYGMCPKCGYVRWQVFDGTKTFGSAAIPSTEHLHLYLADDATYTGENSINAVVISGDGSICLHLNAKTLTMKDGRFWASGGATENAFINVFGTNGEIKYSNSSSSVLQQYTGSALVYGGTYTAVNTELPFMTSQTNATLKDVTIKGAIRFDSIANVFKLEGKTNIDEIRLGYENAGTIKYGNLELDSSWSGTATLNLTVDEFSQLPAGKIFYTGKAPTGKLKLLTGEDLAYIDGGLEIAYPEELTLDSNGYGNCAICGKVKWEKYDGTKQYLNITTKRHFYLAENTTYTNESLEMLTIGAGGKVCFNLNGKFMTVNNGRFQLADATSELNIFTTNGRITYSNPTDSFILQNKGKVNVIGGTYTAANTTADFATVGGTLVLKNAAVKGNVVTLNDKALIELQGTTGVKKINLDNGGKIKLSSDWTGTIVLDMEASELVGGKVPTDKVYYTGKAPTGKVMLVSGEIMKCENGALKVDTSYTGELILDDDGFGVCPDCKEGVQWTEFTGTQQYTDIATSRHFYLAKDTTYTYESINMITITANGKVCFHLNGKTLTIPDGRFWLHGGANDNSQLNIFGNNGKIKYSNASTSVIQHYYGLVKIQGGTYVSVDAGAPFMTAQRNVVLTDAIIKGEIKSDSVLNYYKLEGKTKVDKISIGFVNAGTTKYGNLELDSGWTGSATVNLTAEEFGLLPAGKIFYTGDAPTGKLKLISGEDLVYNNGTVEIKYPDELIPDADGYAECPTCGNVKWTKFSANKTYGAVGSALTEHLHLYLTDNVTYTGEKGLNMAVLGANGKICLHLNGKALNVTNGRFWLTSSTSAINIFTSKGSINYSNPDDAFIRLEKGKVVINGGTYTAAGTTADFATVGGTLVLKNANVKGNITTLNTSAQLQLQGATKVKKINLDNGGAVKLASSWSGSTVLDMDAAELVGGKVPADKVSYTGKAPTGKVMLTSGEILKYNAGALEIDTSYTGELILDEDGFGVCPGCKEAVQWTEFTGTQQYTDIANHMHFYLAKNTKYTVESINMITITANGKVCFHLNGKTLTVPNGRFWLHGGANDNSQLNIYGNNGKIKYTNETNGLIGQYYGLVNIQGGTYVATNAELPFITSARNVVLNDAIVKGKIKSDSVMNYFKLEGKTKVDEIDLSYDVSGATKYGNLELASSWTGTATLKLTAEEFAQLPTGKVFYSGIAPTGKLYLLSGEKLVAKYGVLGLPSDHVDELVLDDFGYGDCPTCGRVQWTMFTGADQYTNLTTHEHFYLAGDTTYSNESVNMITIGAEGKVCFHLNGYTLTIPNGRFWITGSANDNSALNIFGKNGQIKYSNPTTNLIGQYYGNVNIYDGTYTAVNTTAMFLTSARNVLLQNATVNGDLRSDSVMNIFKLEGSTTVGKINLDYLAAGVTKYGSVEFASNWTGSATVNMTKEQFEQIPTGYLYYTGTAPTGTVKLLSGEKLICKSGVLRLPSDHVDELILDDFGYGLCTVCNANVQWSKFDGTAAISSNATPTTTHQHVYLDSNVSYNGDALSVNLAVISEGGSVCFHLNGYTLNVNNARLWIGDGASEDSAINIITTNGVVNYTGRGFIQQNKGLAKIYGGTYNAVDGTSEFASVGGQMIIKDATVNANIVDRAGSPVIELQGTTTTQKINLDNGGKLQLNSNWSGSAILDMHSEDLTETRIPTTKVSYTGTAPTGTMTLASGETLNYVDGGVEFVRQIVPGTTFEEDCPVCGEVTWTKFDGTRAYTVTEGHRHFYLANDVTETIDAAELIKISAVKDGDNYTSYGSVCFYLNGHTLTVDNGYFWLSNTCKDYSSTLNIIAGEGGAINYSGSPIVMQNYGNLNVIGGTYTGANGEAFAECITRDVTLDNADIKGAIVSQSNAAGVTLKGATNVGLIDFATYDVNSRLAVDGTWTGTAKLSPKESALVDGVLNDRYTYTGTPTGTLMLATNEALAFKDGAIGIPQPEIPFEEKCPVCNTDVEWTKFDGKRAFTVTNEHKHFYLAGDVTETISEQVLINIGKDSDTVYGSVCFYLNGHTLTVDNGYFWLSNTCKDYSSTLNIIAGEGGAINYSGSPIVDQRYGILNVIGGTYTGANGESFADCLTRGVTLTNAKVGKLVSLSGATHITLKGTTETGSIDYTASNSALTVDGTWTGKATLTPYDGSLVDGVLNTAKYKYTDTPTGNLSLSTGEALEFKDEKICVVAEEEEDVLILDDNNYGVCPACGNVQWELYDGTAAISSNGEPLTTHRHLYLAEDTSYNGNTLSGNMAVITGSGKLCFHLNGKTLTVTNARLWLGTTATDAVLNIFGTDGGAVNYSDRPFIQVNDGNANIYGGTYSGYETFATAYGYNATSKVMLKDATVSGNLVVGEYKVVYELQGSTTVNKVTLDYLTSAQVQRWGKLELASDWTGSAVLDLDASELTEGKVPTTVASYTGTTAPTGTVKLTSGETLSYVGGGLELVQADELVLDDQNKGICPACGEVTWTAFEAGKPIGSAAAPITNQSVHYYLTEDITYNSSTSANIAALSAGGKLCFHLNGRTLTVNNARIFLTGGSDDNTALNIFTTNGSIIANNDSRVLVDHYNGGSVNFYGGTYTSATTAVVSSQKAVTIHNATFNGDVNLLAANASVTLFGNTNITGNINFNDTHNGSKIVVDKSFTGSVKLNENEGMLLNDELLETRGSANGDFTGRVIVSTGEFLTHQEGKLVVSANHQNLEFITGTQTAHCTVCDADVTWTKVGASEQRVGALSDGAHHHYYLDTDFATANTFEEALSLTGNTTMCLHLNGHNLTNENSVFYVAAGSKLNLLGSGNVIFTGTIATDKAAAVIAEGALNLYTGAILNTVEDKDTVYINGGNVLVKSATVLGNVEVAYGNLTLDNGAYVPAIQVMAAGKLTVNETFTGIAGVTFPTELVENAVAEANGASTGAFTGQLTMADGTVLTGSEGKLVKAVEAAA